ncbi:MAG TPA: hypothetical protein VFJ75_04020 [Gaiellaceae bacterium]|nr:hypothetical protein [Gaiellaceae bacterium]
MRALVVALAVTAIGVPALFAGTSTTLRVHELVATGSPLPVEGAIPYIRVSRADGSTAVRRRLTVTNTSASVAVPVAAGRYRLQSWQRYCDGNCSRLGPPTDRCARWFGIRRGQTLKATIAVRYGSGCTIRFG